MNNFYTKTFENTLTELDSSPSGLSYVEARKRLEKNGKNELAHKKKKSGLVKFLSQFKDVLIIVLLVSAVISIVMGAVEKNYEEFIDAGIILIVVLFNAIIGFIQERNSERAMESLKSMTKPYCTVTRQGRTFKIKSEDLVLGDIVVLEAGDIVPADLRLIETSSLKIEESALTGESLPIEKDANVVLEEDAVVGDRINMAFMGSVVSYGRGIGIVVGTGMNTEMGKIASALSEMSDTTTPLTKRIKKTSIIITIIVAVVCVAVFVVGLLTGEKIISAFSMAIALAVCAIPEGLPACNTVTMSMGVKRMSAQRAIVKSLPTVETLGSTEVICSDKTGTLTLNKMTVKEVFFLSEKCSLLHEYMETQAKSLAPESYMLEEAKEESKVFRDDRNLMELLRCMLLCNDAKAKFEDGKLESIGDPTEIALVHYGYLLGINKERIDGKFKRVNEIPFDSDRKLMTTFNSVHGKNTVYTKGAVDNILARCTKILDNGKIRKITNADKELVLNANSTLASKALRNLAFAFKTVDKIGRPTSENTENDLCFIGLVGMIDPPREEVKDAIKTCKQAGIEIDMIKGDHKDTAFANAKELGICNDPRKVLTGKELSEISDEEFVKKVQSYEVYARVSPEHKVRIVKALKANDKIVAMTGDGVNDAPGIKSADIGVGMGITGTDVTKEAADMILTDDNFATIVGAVKEGRHTYNTILKILMFLLGTSIAELITLSIILFAFRDEHFFTPALLLWINFVSDTFVGLALGFEKPEKNIMKRKPIKNNNSLFKGNVGINIFCSALFVSAFLITLYCVTTLALHLSSQEVTTICFIYLCFVELFHSFNLKSETISLFGKNPFDNKWLNLSFILSALLTVLLVIVPISPIQNAMGVTMIVWWQWLLALVPALFIIPYFEFVKWMLRIKGRRKDKKVKVQETWNKFKQS